MRRPRRVSPRNFLAGLSPSHFEVFRSVMRPVEFEDGAVLFRQGDVARCAYIVDTGRIGMTVRLPGGADRDIARAASGEILGELGLIADTRRSTTARAEGPVRALMLDRVDFRGLLAYFHPASLAVTQRLALLVSERLRETALRITSLADVAPGAGTDAGLAAGEAERSADFDYKPFLARLPFFAQFTAEDLDEFLALVGDSVWSLPRGRRLFEQGDTSDSAFVVVRGAVELLTGDRHLAQRTALLGPGNIVGLLSPLLESRRCSTARIREDALLLEIPAAACEALQQDERRVSFKFMTAYVRHLAKRQAELNRLLIRLEQSRMTESLKATRAGDLPAVGRVLIVDDSPLNRGVIADHLDDMGFAHDEAVDGLDALEKLAAAGPFDAVLLDVRMPRLDGYATLGRMKDDPSLASVPVIMITAVDSLDSALECLRLGAEDYLPRTFDESLLEARLRSCMERRHFIA